MYDPLQCALYYSWNVLAVQVVKEHIIADKYVCLCNWPICFLHV